MSPILFALFIESMVIIRRMNTSTTLALPGTCRLKLQANDLVLLQNAQKSSIETAFVVIAQCTALGASEYHQNRGLTIQYQSTCSSLLFNPQLWE